MSVLSDDPFLLSFSLDGSSAHGVGLPTFRVLISETSYRHTQGRVSEVIPNLVKLTMMTGHHRQIR